MHRSAQAILSRSIRQYTRTWPQYTQHRHYAKRETPTLPTVELCPEPSCECRPTPEGLDIDHVSPMTKPYYDEHVIISTGTSGWSSRLDEDTDTGAAYQALRYFLNVTPRPDGSRRFGEFYNVRNSIFWTAVKTNVYATAHSKRPGLKLFLQAYAYL